MASLHNRVALGSIDVDLVRHTTICSWLTPLLLAGIVSEIWWISASFCQQIDPGDYDPGCCFFEITMAKTPAVVSSKKPA